MKIHFLFIDPHVVQNLCDLLNLWNTKEGFQMKASKKLKKVS